MRRLAVFAAFLVPALVVAQKAPFSVGALLQVQRLGEPQVSPDGSTVAFTVSLPDIAGNRSARSIWTVPVAGGSPRKLADQAERPRWSPDSKRIFYTGTSGGSSQVWAMNGDGSSQTQITRLATEASGGMLSPDGKYLLVLSEVFPECGADDECNKKKLDEASQSKVKARLINGLLYRHWTQWQGETRSHLLSFALDGGILADSKPVDLTPGDKVVPPFSLGGPEDYAIAPDSHEVVFVMNSDAVPAVSTNSDLYVVPITGGASHRVTTGPGSDSGPQYSPDGKFLAYRSQARGGYESDKQRLVLLERSSGKLTMPVDAIDRSVESFSWTPDSRRIFFTTMDRGHQGIQFVAVEGGVIRMVVTSNHVRDDVQFTPDGRNILYTRQSGSSPVEICKITSSGGTETALTHLNDALLDQFQLTALEDFYVPGADNAQVQSFLIKPPNFDPKIQYPVLMLIHGGPQGEWGESWSYRWNAQAMAAAGYVVVMPNPRGSFGYGQKFTDDINQDWGGKAYDDIMAVTDAAAKLPYVDSARMVAAGGSYGGYMIDWMLGHTNRFKALISHAGVYDLRSEAETTEELWFPLWEFGGMPWDKPEVYDKWSPSKFSQEFKTPTLVIHGELDFRVPVNQGLQLFTALQLHKTPSQLLVFPDEGHWVLKPQNSMLWYKTFLDWMDRWTKK